MANVKIPYSLTPAVATPIRRQNMIHAIGRGFTRLDRQPSKVNQTMHLAAFGPSLKDTYEALRGQHPIMAMSGSTKWLAERGIIVDYALEMDPRPRKAMTSLPPVPGVTYLIASCVDPTYFDAIVAAGNPIQLWHTVSTSWEDETAFVSAHDPGQLVVHGGSTIGLTAIHLGGLLGYSRFEIHGMDGSFDTSGHRHAGVHHGKTQKDDIEWQALGTVYKTSRIMANAVAESVNTAKNFPIITIWHGQGLTQALIRKANLPNACCADETDKRTRLSGLWPKMVQTSNFVTGPSIWDGLLGMLHPEDLPDLIANIAVCEPRRVNAKYNTGTIPFESAVYLRAMCRFFEPQVIAEVGTFIGTSTLALIASRALYTCDRNNDCLPATETILTHPYQTSTQMLKEIQEPVDLFFFDGRIQAADLVEIQRLAHPETVFVFDDYHGNAKGIANVHVLAPLFPKHTLVTPGPGASTVAMLVANVVSVEKVA